MSEILEIKQESNTVKWRVKIDTFIVLLISLTPFNFSSVDKTGLNFNVDNDLDKVMRVAWFFFSLCIIFILKPRLFVGFFYKPSAITKLLLCYMLVLVVSLLINDVGVAGFYRLCEYALLLFALDILDKTIRQKGREKAIDIFAGWVQISAVLILSAISVGLIIVPDHFYALETQGRLRLGGNAYSPNFIGMVFALGVLSSMYLFGRQDVLVKKIILMGGVIVFSIALYFTGSRTAQFSLVLAIGLWFYLTRSVVKRWGLCVGVAIFVLPLMLIFYPVLVDRILPLMGKGERPIYDLLTLNNRSVVAEVGLQGALDNWLFGVGFVEGVKEYYRLNFTQSYWLPPHSHNAVIESFLSGGILALLLMLVVFYMTLKLVLKNITSKLGGADIFLAVLAVPLIFGCLTMTIFGGVYTVLTFWFFSLALFSWSRYERKNSICH